MINRVALIALAILCLVQSAVIATQHRAITIETWVIRDFGINWTAEHAALVACRSGHLKEFREKNLEEFREKTK